MNITNALQNDQKQVTSHPNDSLATTWVFELMKMAKSIKKRGKTA
jgi:hypothetical protein